MGFKKRGYNKDDINKKTRDYSLFAIACEGTEREPQYFRPFNGIDRIKVDIIENKVGKRNSAPNGVLKRAQDYIDDVGFSEEDGDSLWLVIDMDKWPRGQLELLYDYCSHYPNIHLVMSNPCFEVWLLYHKLTSLDNIHCDTANQTKQALHTLEKGGYFYLNYLPLIKDAIQNAKLNDTNKEHYYPNIKTTKVYQLGEALLNRMGIRRFESFLLEIEKMKKDINKRLKK